MKTMIEPTFEQTKEKLKGHRPPPFAYVLFETNEINNMATGDKVLDHGLFTLRVDQRPDIGGKLDQYLAKGFKILHYDNFPKMNDDNPARAQMAKIHSKPGGRSAWDILEAKTKRLMNLDPNWEANKIKLEEALNAKDQEVKALQERIAAMQSKGGKDGGLHQKQ